MSELLNKAAYLKGYAEGMGGMNSNEGKIIDKLLEVIEEMAQELEYLAADVAENRESIDELDNTFYMLAEDVYEEYDYDEDDDDFLDLYDDDDDEFFDDDEEFEEIDDNSDLFEIQCPECGDDFMIEYDEIIDGGEIRCPHCEKKVELDIDFDDDDEI